MSEPASETFIKNHRDLRVYQTAMEGAMRLFEMTKAFPAEERFSLVDQVRRSSRSVCANIAEAWRKRRYAAHFVSKLSDAEGEAAETLAWIEFSERCGSISKQQAAELTDLYDKTIAQLVGLAATSKRWNLS